MSKDLEPVESLVDRIDLPHKRVQEWVWRPDPDDPAKPMISRSRLIHYASRLREHGMSDGDIACLISDLYWDSFNECVYNECFTKEGA
jgi:hypothetical protein